MKRCRVISQRTIQGRPYAEGETLELDNPIRDFLIEHGVVVLEPEKTPKEQRGKDGAAV